MKKKFYRKFCTEYKKFYNTQRFSISCSHTPWPVRAKTLYITCLGGYIREIFFFYMWVKFKQLGSWWRVWLQSEVMLSTA